MKKKAASKAVKHSQKNSSGMPDNTAVISPTENRLYLSGAAILIVFAIFIAYSNVLQNSFVYYDDNVYVTENYRLSQGFSADNISWAFSTFYAGNWHPLTWLSHILDVKLFGLNPAGHHFVNVLLHSVCALLLLFFLRFTTKNSKLAAFTAALFALHPLHVESVAWIAERKDVLCALFWLATMLAYAHYAKRKSFGGYLFVILLYASALMSKPMAVTLPIVLLLLDYWPLERFQSKWKTIARLLIEKIPLFALAIASSAITIIAQHDAIGGFNRLSTGVRISNAILSYCTYILQAIWPSKLAVFYPYTLNPQIIKTLISALALMLVTAAVLRAGQKKKYLITGWFWYIVTLLPVIGIIQVGDQAHADRYTYLPTIGLFIMFAWAVSEFIRNKIALKHIITAGVIVITVALGCISYKLTGFWKDDISLFSRAVTVTKNNFQMKMKLGDALFARGRYNEAFSQFEESLRIKPWAYTYSAIGSVFQAGGQLDSALSYYKKALSMDPGIKSALLNISVTLSGLGRNEEAIGYAGQAVKLDPVWDAAYIQMGLLLAACGKLDEGEDALKKAVSLAPGLADAHSALASVYVRKGNFAYAAGEYEKSCRIKRELFTLCNLAACLAEAGKKSDAVNIYREALAMSPQNSEIRFDLAKTLANMGNKAEALDELKRAMSLSPNNAEINAFYRTLSGKNK